MCVAYGCALYIGFVGFIGYVRYTGHVLYIAFTLYVTFMACIRYVRLRPLHGYNHVTVPSVAIALHPGTPFAVHGFHPLYLFYIGHALHVGLIDAKESARVS